VAYGPNLFSIELFTLFRIKPCFYPFVGVRRDIARTGQDAHLPVIIEWLQHCKNEHPACASSETPPPSRVVDVGIDALTNISLYLSWGESAPYAALSHCCGKTGTLRTTLENYHIRRRAIPFTELPQTFKDAVFVTRGLGIIYLWIDSLCIVQDDKEDCEAESVKMAAIDNNAYVVIGADKSKDGNGGFLRRDAEIESCRITIVENNDGSRSEVHARQHEQQGNFVTPFSSCNSPLASRAWTLQQQSLSSRMVHFADELYRECRAATYYECIELDTYTSPIAE
jgi:hypothetical protein